MSISLYISYTSYLYLDCRGATRGTTTDPQLADGKGDLKNNNDNTRGKFTESDMSCLHRGLLFAKAFPTAVKVASVPCAFALPAGGPKPTPATAMARTGADHVADQTARPHGHSTWGHCKHCTDLHWQHHALSIKHHTRCCPVHFFAVDWRFACELHPKIKTRYLQRLVRYSNGISQRALPHSQAADWLWQDRLPAWFMT